MKTMYVNKEEHYVCAMYLCLQCVFHSSFGGAILLFIQTINPTEIINI